MEVERLRALLEAVQNGVTPVEEALSRLRDLPYEDLGYAKLDHHRALRNGFPEVIYCQGKSIEQIVGIAGRLRERSSKVLATRAAPDVADSLQRATPDCVYHDAARIVVIPGNSPSLTEPVMRGTVLVVSAGTADIPVAEEAAVTASEMGSPVDRMYDVGVAGLHRLLDQKDRLFSASVLIVVAGMEGALASVVGGLVSRPVIAVPTSVGYGASFQGLAALLAMLNSCASGVAVMNIDNGFGAGYFAHLVNQP
jgi:pyridinium-3,5-biscarboxylic acid mononucleotide synthase